LEKLPDIEFSDVHAGLETCLAGAVAKLLTTTRFRKAVMCGDLSNGNLDLSRFSREQWQLLMVMRELAQEDRLVFVWGNHDPKITKLLEALCGIKAVESYEWEWYGRTCLAIHGHQWDRVCCKSSICASVLTWLLTWLLAHKWLHFGAERLMDSIHVDWEKLTPKIRDGAIALAKRRGATIVLCGHTHKKYGPETIDGVTYVNSGCCLGGLGDPITYVMIDDGGPHVLEFRG
jgi:predicted phosphodiesterase